MVAMKSRCLAVLVFLVGLVQCSFSSEEEPIAVFSEAKEEEEFEGDRRLALLLIGQEFVTNKINWEQLQNDCEGATSIRYMKGSLVLFSGKKSRKLLIPIDMVIRFLMILPKTPANESLEKAFMQEFERWRQREKNLNEFDRQISNKLIVMVT